MPILHTTVDWFENFSRSVRICLTAFKHLLNKTELLHPLPPILQISPLVQESPQFSINTTFESKFLIFHKYLEIKENRPRKQLQFLSRIRWWVLKSRREKRKTKKDTWQIKSACWYRIPCPVEWGNDVSGGRRKSRDIYDTSNNKSSKRSMITVVILITLDKRLYTLSVSAVKWVNDLLAVCLFVEDIY